MGRRFGVSGAQQKRNRLPRDRVFRIRADFATSRKLSRSMTGLSTLVCSICADCWMIGARSGGGTIRRDADGRGRNAPSRSARLSDRKRVPKERYDAIA